MWTMIGTWRMVKEGMEKAAAMLDMDQGAADAIEEAIREVEDFPYFKSVGYGGLPNEDKVVELDAAFMDGDSLSIGAVCAIHDFANPVSIARRLSENKVNCMLASQGAEKYARQHGFEEKSMLTKRAEKFYEERKSETNTEISPYNGHDTVGVVCLDQKGKLCAATSTSGLFMKHEGRVGDSPLVGSGFYADSEIGGATATGLGEDLMKGCISYEIVRLIEMGYHPQEACEIAVNKLDQKLRQRRQKAGDLSVVALDNQGRWGCATNLSEFSFVVATQQEGVVVYLTRPEDGRCVHQRASQEWIDNYLEIRMAWMGEEE